MMGGPCGLKALYDVLSNTCKPNGVVDRKRITRKKSTKRCASLWGSRYVKIS